MAVLARGESGSEVGVGSWAEVDMNETRTQKERVCQGIISCMMACGAARDGDEPGRLSSGFIQNAAAVCAIQAE